MIKLEAPGDQYEIFKFILQLSHKQTMVEHGDLSPGAKQEYREYHGRLAEALRAVDLANARSQRAPHVSSSLKQTISVY